MSHTGNALGNFGVEGLRRTKILTPVMAAQNLRGALHCWYNADFVSIDTNGLVSGALDLTGKGNNGTQPTEANRLMYFPSDSMFGGIASIGSTIGTGIRHLLAGSTIPRQVIASCYYKTGTESVFSAYAGLFGPTTGSSGLILGNTGVNGEWFSLFNTSSTATYSKNGNAAQIRTGKVLPLPASTLTMTAVSTQILRIYQFGCDVATTNRTWIGGFRNLIIVTGSISAAEVALIEGAIAWDGNHQNLLAANHPYRFIPPLVRD
jgi:hypothetical protein